MSDETGPRGARFGAPRRYHSPGSDEPLYPDVSVHLTINDASLEHLVGNVALALRKAGYKDGSAAFVNAACEADTFAAVVRLVNSYVETT